MQQTGIPIFFYRTSTNSGVQTKKNLFYELLKSQQKEYSIYIELESDVILESSYKNWLDILETIILDTEKHDGHRLIWSVEYDFPCACRIISHEAKKLLGYYPAENTGHYTNFIEEMARFPKDFLRYLQINNFKIRIIRDLTKLKYDLLSKSTNYILLGFTKKLDLSSQKQVDIAIKKYTKNPYPKIFLPSSKIERNNLVESIHSIINQGEFFTYKEFHLFSSYIPIPLKSFKKISSKINLLKNLETKQIIVRGELIFFDYMSPEFSQYKIKTLKYIYKEFKKLIPDKKGITLIERGIDML